MTNKEIQIQLALGTLPLQQVCECLQRLVINAEEKENIEELYEIFKDSEIHEERQPWHGYSMVVSAFINNSDTPLPIKQALAKHIQWGR